MIYTYRHLPHRIENFNRNIAHFFEQLFANDLAVYDEVILLQEDFISIVNRSPVSLKGHLETITLLYHQLPAEAKLVLQTAFGIANDIAALCSDESVDLVKFDDIHDDIREELKAFSVSLWEDFPQNQLVEQSFGQVQDHFNAFTLHTHQKALVCPFCGLHKLKPTGGRYRDAYDHYIPKAFYPFISFNLSNLFPICHECNSDEKRATDTLYHEAGRRALFYPYDHTYQPEELSISVVPTMEYNPVNLKTLLSDINWDYSMTYCGAEDARLTSWDDIFHIALRYRENILVYQTEWFEQIVAKYKREKSKGTLFGDFQDEVIDEAKSFIYSWPLGILRYIYFMFLFSTNDFEMRLSALTEQ